MSNVCYVCGGAEFGFKPVLWGGLIQEWQLSQNEADYINRQQGLYCMRCESNLRSMALARAILRSYDFNGTLTHFVESPETRHLRVLEINQAGAITSSLHRLARHRLITYPAYDMTKLAIETASYDLVVHSDTLEHVEFPLSGLSECRRVLADGGRCIFTVPIIVDRFTRPRNGLPASRHGSPTEKGDDYLVHTEFGADIWKHVIESGFTSVTIHCAEYPAGLAIEARL